MFYVWIPNCNRIHLNKIDFLDQNLKFKFSVGSSRAHLQVLNANINVCQIVDSIVTLVLIDWFIVFITNKNKIANFSSSFLKVNCRL